MPELPEVETVKTTLNRLVAGKTIARASVTLPRIIRHPADPAHFCALLEGQTIREIARRGKFLRFLLTDYVLVSHLRMEGRYGVYRTEEEVGKHTHVIFHFTDGTELRYRDVRQFGTMHLFAAGEELASPPLNKLGLEPLDDSFTLKEFRRRLEVRPTKIKPLLLNQEYVAGLGNIYVDESLFAAGLHPEREASSLTSAEWARLHAAIVSTLKEAVRAGGSSVKSYVNGQGEMGMFQQQLKVYGRKNEPCFRCGSPIEKFVVGGRGTHICPACQPLRRKRRTKRSPIHAT
jgi:formamidopyrimidine-DNA glycosylase